MIVMFTTHLLEEAPKNRKNEHSAFSSVLTIGNFDGYHIGHQEILKKLESVSKEYSLPAYIVTFEPNPKIFFKKEISLLQTPAQRLSTLRTSGVDGIFVIDFSRAHALSGEEFIQSFLTERFRLKHLVVGEDFRLGKNRSYTLDMMCQQLASQNVSCSIVKPVEWEGQAISSSRIREAIRIGELEEAAEMLGRPYSIEGVVVRGDGIGTKIGFPTINTRTENPLLPLGVFISKASFSQTSRVVWGITNIGTRPTVSGTEERIETYLPQFQGNMYGHDVVLSLIKKMRNEICFESTTQLAEQISSDVNNLELYLKQNKTC